MSWENNSIKIFRCDCYSEGVTVSLLRDDDLDNYQEAPYISMSFWEHSIKHTSNKLCLKQRLIYAWQILTKGSLWTDMIMMNRYTAKKFANYILKLIKEFDEEKKC